LAVCSIATEEPIDAGTIGHVLPETGGLTKRTRFACCEVGVVNQWLGTRFARASRKLVARSAWYALMALNYIAAWAWHGLSCCAVATLSARGASVGW
jgi:hypothetical protein